MKKNGAAKPVKPGKTNKQTNKQTNQQTNKQTETQTQTETETQTQTKKHTNKKHNKRKQRKKQTYKQTDKQTIKQTCNKNKTNKQTDRQTDKQLLYIIRQTKNKHMNNCAQTHDDLEQKLAHYHNNLKGCKSPDKETHSLRCRHSFSESKIDWEIQQSRTGLDIYQVFLRVSLR